MPSFEEDVSVFDLPNLKSQPTFEELQRTLQALELKPKSWTSASTQLSGGMNEAAISRYLTNIISNLFEWFDGTEAGDTDEKRETLWDLASKRVTERCGRSAMGELNRTWTIPASKALPELSFAIREPPLTGDNLGFKTWGTAFAMAKRLEHIKTCFLEDALQRNDARVLELGAGTGLVGIAAAGVWSADVLLTDLDEIQENLDFNIRQNLEVVTSRGGSVAGCSLDWKSSDGLDHGAREFEVVIAADSLYDDEHPDLVSNMIKTYLRRDRTSRALVAVPIRDKNTTRMAAEFKTRLHDLGFSTIHEGWEICQDDWESSEDEGGVKCWWALFGWAAAE